MKEFIKKKYNILIPIFLLVVLLIAILLYTREYKNNRYAYVSEVDVYQYFSGNKMEYVANISRNKSDGILEYENKDYPVSLDSTPVYIKDKDNVIPFGPFILIATFAIILFGIEASNILGIFWKDLGDLFFYVIILLWW